MHSTTTTVQGNGNWAHLDIPHKKHKHILMRRHIVNDNHRSFTMSQIQKLTTRCFKAPQIKFFLTYQSHISNMPQGSSKPFSYQISKNTALSVCFMYLFPFVIFTFIICLHSSYLFRYLVCMFRRGPRPVICSSTTTSVLFGTLSQCSRMQWKSSGRFSSP